MEANDNQYQSNNVTQLEKIHTEIEGDNIELELADSLQTIDKYEEPIDRTHPTHNDNHVVGDYMQDVDNIVIEETEITDETDASDHNTELKYVHSNLPLHDGDQLVEIVYESSESHVDFGHQLALDHDKSELEMGALVSEDAMELPCPTCLAPGRTLSPLRDAAQAYCMLLAGLRQEDVEELVTYTMLCWECNCLVERMLRFQAQLLRANAVMRSLVGDASEHKLEPLSSLVAVLKDGYDCTLQDSREVRSHRGRVRRTDNVQPLAKTQVEAAPHPVRKRKNNRRSWSNVQPVRKSARRATAHNDEELSDGTESYEEQVKTEAPASPELAKTRRRAVVRKLGSWPGKKSLTKGRKKNVKIVSVSVSHEEMLRFREEDKQKESYQKLKFRCEHCIKSFKFVNLLEKHNASTHSEEAGEHECDICLVRVPTQEQLVRHRKKHYNLYVCTVCGYTERSLPEMFKHFTSVHEQGKLHPCDQCGETFESARKMRYHREISHRASYKCEYCNKLFTNSQSFKSHVLIHTGMPQLACSICSKQCRGESGLYAHMRTAHDYGNTPQEAYCCECNIQFKNKAIYRSHLRNSIKHFTPAQLKHACDQCDKRLPTAVALRTHVRYYHMEYTCGTCDKRLNNMYSLDKHIKFVHEKREMPRKHICETCGKGFKTRRALESHLLTHTGERPHSCDIYSAAFAQKSTLRTHQRLVHMKEKKSSWNAPSASHEQPPPQDLSPVSRELQPVSRELQPVSQELQPVSRELPVVSREIQPGTQGLVTLAQDAPPLTHVTAHREILPVVIAWVPTAVAQHDPQNCL